MLDRILRITRGIVARTGVEVRRVAVLGLLGAAVAGFAWLLLPARYVSEASLLIEPPEQALGAASLSQFSEALSAGGLAGLADRENGYTYIEVLRSRSVLEAVLLHRRSGTDSAQIYLEHFGPRTLPMRKRLEVAIRKMRKATKFSYSTRDHLLHISVKSRNPAVSAEVVALLVEALRAFNATTRMSRAREAAQFVGERVIESRGSLQAAEAKLAQFQESNMRIGNSPELRLTQKRLERDVRLNEEVYGLLSKQFEIASIQQKKEAPVFTVIDQATLPTDPDRLPLVVTIFLGFVFSCLAAFLAEVALSQLDQGIKSGRA